MTTNRTKAREFALQVLYEIDTSGKDPETALMHYWKHFEQVVPDPTILQFTKKLVIGVAESRDELDSIVEKCSINWRLDRMPRVDRNVLRLAVFELVKSTDVPMKVVINEAIEIAKRFGSEESGAFVNGILDRVAAEVGRT